MRYMAPSRIEGTIAAPPSKSVAQRALLAAVLAEGESVIRSAGAADDVRAAMGAAEALGAEVTWHRETDIIAIRGRRRPPRPLVDCGESGTCLRIAVPIAALFSAPVIVTGKGSLLGRPTGPLETPLNALGAACTTRSGKPPVTVRGPLQGGHAVVDATLTSQLVSGLIMALPLAEQDSEIEARGLVSRGYVDLTVSVLARFGIAVDRDERTGPESALFRIRGGQAYKPASLAVEGDWSGTAFLLVAGALAGDVTVMNLAGDQPDAAVLAALDSAGAHIDREAGAVRVRRGDLRGFDFDATHAPDLFPPLVALACHCRGTTVLRGLHRLRHKETDRAAALADEFARIGADLTIRGDILEIRGGPLSGGRLLARGDHRIAMAGAVAACLSEGGVTVEGDECVAKSYPDFFRDLARLGATS